MRWWWSLGLILAPCLLLCFCCAAFAAHIDVSNQAPRQGQTIEVTVTGLEPAGEAPEVKFNGNACKLFPSRSGQDLSCLMAVPADLKPGTYPLSVGSQEIPLQVVDAHFPLQHLSLSKSKDNFDMGPGEKQAVEGAKATVSSHRFWQSTFQRPSKCRISAGFGLRRAVNGRLLKDYFHSGIDFAAPEGSPVTACADGDVVLAHNGFRLHGNIVAIDHGQGVVSFYIHMHSIGVKEGQTVKAGERIGTVGHTGRANGPHLHYSIYVNRVATNPMQWFSQAF